MEKTSEGDLSPKQASVVTRVCDLGGGASLAIFASSGKRPWAAVPKPGGYQHHQENCMRNKSAPSGPLLAILIL